jgi:NNP family nitrate/nitrite transporter-like MFS transporter
MGLVYGATGDYSLGYILLAITAAAAGALTTTAVRRRVEERATA